MINLTLKAMVISATFFSSAALATPQVTMPTNSVQFDNKFEYELLTPQSLQQTIGSDLTARQLQMQQAMQAKMPRQIQQQAFEENQLQAKFWLQLEKTVKNAVSTTVSTQALLQR